jgi:exonuclease VII large subunit
MIVNFCLFRLKKELATVINNYNAKVDDLNNEIEEMTRKYTNEAKKRDENITIALKKQAASWEVGIYLSYVLLICVIVTAIQLKEQEVEDWKKEYELKLRAEIKAKETQLKLKDDELSSLKRQMELNRGSFKFID